MIFNTNKKPDMINLNRSFRLLFALLVLTLTTNLSGQLPDDFPSITVNKTGETAPGYLFLSVSADVEGTGYYIMMLDDNGLPFKYKKLIDDYSYDFKVQPNGLLSYAQFLSHHSYTGGGNCIHMVLNEDMEIVDSFQLGNGYIAEAHDFQLLPNGHVLAFGYYLTQMDLSEIVEGGYPNAMVSGGIVQELDQDKNVVWQWRSWDHYDEHDYIFGRRSSRQTVSEFHLNTINLDKDGNMFLGTPGWTKKINRQNGEIMWHLGGNENEFTFVGVDSLEGVNDVTGHTFYRLENGNVLIYDNGPRTGPGTSEAHEYKIDEVHKIAEKIKSFTPTEEIPGWHRGSAQRLSNGNTLVGWGGGTGDLIPTCTEFDSLGNTVLEVFFDNPAVESYRAVRFPYPPAGKYTASYDEIAEGNTYEFFQGDTLDIGIKIKLTQMISAGYTVLNVDAYDYAPLSPKFENRAPAVLPQRVELSAQSINYIGGQISFDVNIYDLDNPDLVTVYFRPAEGDGTFIPLSTSYNSVTKKITVDFDDFGEFIFTYPDIDHQVIRPRAVEPYEGSLLNNNLPVKIEWAQDGFFNTFDIQLAKDEAFTELLMEESNYPFTYKDVQMLEANKEYFWRVRTNNDAGQSDWSETASFKTTAPYLNITSPNGDEVWDRGLEYFIEWEGNTKDDVVLDLYKDSQFLMNIDTVPNTDAYLWELPVDLDSACNYSVLISSTDNPAIQDVSDFSFSINDSACLSAAVPYVKLLSPNGGEDFDRNSEVVISWENNTGENVAIDLLKGGEFVAALFTGISGNTINWTIENSVVSSNDYTIRITSSGSLTKSDMGNDDFTISGSNSITSEQEKYGFKMYPNPVNEFLHMEYHLDKKLPVTIKLYDLGGNEIRTLVAAEEQSGFQKLSYSVKSLSHGYYIIKAQFGNEFASQAFQFVK